MSYGESGHNVNVSVPSKVYFFMYRSTESI